METFKVNEEILLENDYDSKIWDITGKIFDKTNPDHYSNGKTNRTSHILTQKEADRLNNMIDGDGSLVAGAIITKNGLRIIGY